MTAAAWIALVGSLLVGSTGSGGVVYWLLSRNSERAQIKTLEATRESTLADAATKWQKLLDENSTAAYEKVDARCKRCESALDRVVSALGSVLRAIVPVMEQVAERTEVDAQLVTDLTATLHLAEREYNRHS